MSNDSSAALLSLVRAQIESTLTQAQEAMAKHVAQTAGNSALTGCPLQLHQVYGALRIVRLEGAARYATELESALRNSMRSGAADKTEIENISRAIGALREFVTDTAAGGAYIPQRLFPAYRDLARVSGNESASEKDLFFPDAGIETPSHAEPRVISPPVMPALLKELRSRYQRGLLGWLKESAKPDGLAQMRDVMDTLHKISGGLPEPRGLWWAAIALIEAAITALPDVSQNDWIARVKPVCSRIDFLLRDLAAKSDADPQPVLRDVLYAIALSRVSTERVRDVRARFDLDNLLPAANAGGAGAVSALKPQLDDVQSRLDNIKDTWTEYASGEPKRLQRFREMLVPLTEKSRDLGSAPLVQLFEAITQATTGLPDPYPLDAHIMSLEMASALLMAESIVQHFDALPADLDQQVDIMRGWLIDAAQGKSTTASPPGLRADIVQKVNDANLRIATAREILKSLGQVEKTVEAFTRDHSKQDTLAPLPAILRQVSGVFLVSNQKRASRLATVCQRLIERCAVPGHATLDQDIEWVAEGLGSLGFYLDPCQYGKMPAERAVNMFFMRYEQQAGSDAILTLTQSIPAASAPDKPSEAPAPATPSAASAPAPVPEVRDREMRDVFLEEANEVLAAIESSVAQLQARNNDHDALLSVRRAFHTLKGSARMVGLQPFGECAWEMEQLLNHWRGQALAATPELLSLVSDARELFAEWTYALHDDDAPGIDASGIAARARKLRGEPETTVTPAALAKVSEAVAAPAVAPAPAPASDSASEFMTVLIPPTGTAAPRLDSGVDTAGVAATGANFMTFTLPAAAAAPESAPAADAIAAPVVPGEPALPSPAVLCDQALADLGDRLAWLKELVEEISNQTSTNVLANSRLHELAAMMNESMAEAGALHRALGEHIAALKRKS